MKRYELLLDLIKRHGFNNMLEIGIGKGETARRILEGTMYPYQFHYYGIDPWKEYPEYKNDINGTSARIKNNVAMADVTFLEFEDRVTNHIGMSHELVDQFEDNFFDLIFVDGNHEYEFVKRDLELYWPKLKSMGIMAGHDYGLPHSFPGVRTAVNEFFEEKKLVLHYLVTADVYYFYKP